MRHHRKHRKPRRRNPGLSSRGLLKLGLVGGGIYVVASALQGGQPASPSQPPGPPAPTDSRSQATQATQETEAMRGTGL